eukprot:EC685574.1.p2 GENE.EC685574.1~~EC685574.1.p2  ORF type:complete len:167 (+),score=88.59 EC685574.1:41-541(+)
MQRVVASLVCGVACGVAAYREMHHTIYDAARHEAESFAPQLATQVPLEPEGVVWGESGFSEAMCEDAKRVWNDAIGRVHTTVSGVLFGSSVDDQSTSSSSSSSSSSSMASADVARGSVWTTPRAIVSHARALVDDAARGARSLLLVPARPTSTSTLHRDDENEEKE